MAQLDPVGWFRSAHPEQGSLRVQVSSGRGLFPCPARRWRSTTISARCGETFHTGVTDSSGIVEGILLPALPAAWGCSADTAGISGTAYSVAVRHPQYGAAEPRQVLVFPGWRACWPCP